MAIYNRSTIQKFSILLLFLGAFLCLWGEEKEEKKKTSELPRIIEEIEVVGTAASQQPVSTVSVVPEVNLEKSASRHLGEVLNYVPGTHVTEGQKNESSVSIRGLASSRITLLLDGVPIYEPYFNSFDLSSLSVAGIESVKVVKGAHSVLYGANTLGGVINVLSRRYRQPFFNIDTRFSENGTYFLSGAGGFNLDRLDVFGSVAWDHSDGFYWNNDGEREERFNSDFDRKNFIGKLYFHPSEKSEILAQVMYHTAEYGVPAATEILKSRYWRFNDWRRLQMSLGSAFPLPGSGSLKSRLYYVRHYNVLDAYQSESLDELQWESTYDNYSIGGYMLGEMPLSGSNTLKISLHAKRDNVEQQGDAGEEWEKFVHNTFSLGIENHFSLSDQVKLVGGISADHLNKEDGENKTVINPILGIRYSPTLHWDFHFSLAQKSRFPAMKSLYSSKGGNPDLKDELGRSLELGVSFRKGFRWDISVFYQKILDMIQSYRGLDGYKTVRNIGEADILGAEIELGKDWEKIGFNLSYTYLNTAEADTDGPLDYIPESQINLFLKAGSFKGVSCYLWILGVSESSAKIGKEPPFEVVPIPGYVTANIRLEFQWKMLEFYVKADNLMNKYYITEPGFPMKGRTVSAGFRAVVK